jgi:hypothetical protein
MYPDPELKPVFGGKSPSPRRKEEHVSIQLDLSGLLWREALTGAAGTTDN